MTPLYLVTLVLYGAATAAFVVHIFGRSERLLRLGRWSLALALVAQLALIGTLCTRGFNPLRDVRGALGLSAWLLSVGYLLTTLRSRFAVIGALVAPVSGTLLLASWLMPLGGSPAGMARTLSLLGKLHIALSALGVAAFGLAAAVSMIYLFQEAALKRKRIGTLSRRTPPLTALDEAGRRAILVGFPIFTLAVITGLIWATRLPGEGFRPEHAISAITWMIFAGLIAARVTVGLRGRSAALLTISGFAATLGVLLIYLSRRLLGG
jgi:ABC-type uncharacterized transport system permease subunit